MASTMRAIVIEGGKASSATALKIGEIERPTAGDGQALIKIKAFGLNRMDIIQRKGAYPLPPGVTETLGVEFSGTVEESKSGAFKKGQEVFGLAYGGAYAEYIAVAEGMVIPKPSHLSHAEAAAIPENWLTAYQALFYVCQMKEGERVLIHAGASGVGTAANQLARSFGAEVYTTAGSADKLKMLEKLGVTKGFNYKEQDFAEEILKATNNEGVDCIVDFVGPNYWQQNLKVLARDGRMCLLGLLSGMKADGFDMSALLYKRLRIEGSTMRSRSTQYQVDLLHRFQEKAMPKLLGHCSSGEKYDLVIHQIYKWEDIVEATQEMEQAKNTGKIVCTID